MIDIVNYFIGAMSRLFSYVNPIWVTEPELKLTFIIVVSVLCGITLFLTLSLFKSVATAFINLLRGC